MRLDELVLISRPFRTKRSERLARFGMAKYAFSFPGVSCPLGTSCPAQSYTTLRRHFGDVPPEIAGAAKWLNKQERFNIPISEYEELFGRREPTVEDPAGFRYSPGAQAGEVELFFGSEPQDDVIWPVDGRGLFISERVKRFLLDRQSGGLRFHQVSQVLLLPHPEFLPAPEQARGHCRELQRTFYQVEVLSPAADCGVRFRLRCSACGYTEHDFSAFAENDEVKHTCGRHLFRLQGLGLAVMTKYLSEEMAGAGFRDYGLESALELLRETREEMEERQTRRKEDDDHGSG